jgi:hypothetical protein
MLAAVKGNVTLFEFALIPEGQRDAKVVEAIKTFDVFQADLQPCVHCGCGTAHEDLDRNEGVCYTCREEAGLSSK